MRHFRGTAAIAGCRLNQAQANQIGGVIHFSGFIEKDFRTDGENLNGRIRIIQSLGWPQKNPAFSALGHDCSYNISCEKTLFEFDLIPIAGLLWHKIKYLRLPT
jgi:hypothetical protein